MITLLLFNFRDEKYVIDVYDATPKMSTYLVAFAIGDFDYLETTAGTTLVNKRTVIKFMHA